MNNIVGRESNRENKVNKTVKIMVNPIIQPPEQTDKTIVIPMKEEAKSKRVNLLLKPSVHKEAIRKCDNLGISLNECINQLIAGWVKE